MARPSLPQEPEKITWRMWRSDLDYLRAAFPGRVNDIVRDLVHLYVQRLKARAAARTPARMGELYAEDVELEEVQLAGE